MDTLKYLGAWISAHTNKLTELGRQIMYGLLLFHVINWTPEQQIAALAIVSAFLAMFTDSATVSTQRMGERVEEVKAAAQATVEAKVAEKVAQITGTGTGTGV